MINKTLDNIFKGDKGIWMVFFFLCVISVIEVYSASAQLTYKGGSYTAPVIKHIFLLAVGIFFMVVTLNVKCKYFKMATPFMLVISLVTLLWVFLAGASTNGAQRWISIVGIQFQPSEIAKGTMVLATAQILSALQTEDGADKMAFKYILTVCFFIVPLIMVENLSTALLLCIVIFMMMLLGRVPMRQLGKLLGFAVLFLLIILFSKKFQLSIMQKVMKKKNNAVLGGTFEYVIDDGGVAITSPLGTGKNNWSAFDRWGEQDGYIYLVRLDNNVVLMDKSRLTPDELKELERLLENVKK